MFARSIPYELNKNRSILLYLCISKRKFEKTEMHFLGSVKVGSVNSKCEFRQSYLTFYVVIYKIKIYS